MPGHIFIGRKAELERLQALYQKAIPSLAVIKGRRRIGKSRLITNFPYNSLLKASFNDYKSALRLIARIKQ